MTFSEKEWNEEAAADIVHVMYDPETFEFMYIGIVDENGQLVQKLDRNLARSVAVKLLQLATDTPDPNVRPIRRLSIVDERLRNLEP